MSPTARFHAEHDHDHETPECSECGEPVGVMQDATLLLSGQFFYNKEEQCAMFILDPDTELAIVEIQDALGKDRPQVAIVVNKSNMWPMRAVHEGCLGDFDPHDGEQEEDEDEDDEVEIDPNDPDYEEMKLAIARDRSGWDDDDLLVALNQKG
jgi:hypothetical protein